MTAQNDITWTDDFPLAPALGIISMVPARADIGSPPDMKARSLKILPTLSLSVGLLIFFGIGIVLSIQWTASKRILSDLGGRLVVRNVALIAQGIRGHLDPVRAQVEYLAGLIEGGDYDLGDKRGLADLLVGSVAAAPQIGGVAIGDTELRAIRIRRAAASGRYEVSYPDFGRSAQHRAALTEAMSRESGYWAELFYNPKIDTTFMNYRRPLRRDGKAIGVIAAAVTIKEFSRLAAELTEMFGSTTFVLYGDGKVLAHPLLATKSYPRSAAEPAISADRIGDPVIAALDTAVPSTLIDVSGYKDTRLDEVDVDGIGYFVFRQPLHGYGKVPITIGSYRAAAEVNAPIRLLVWSGLAGLGFLLIALVAAIWLSRLIARPIRRVTEGVTQVGELSFAEVEPIPSSWIREVSDLAASFNDMLGGLKSFEIYVPRKLVQRLIKQEGGAEVTSEERELTVMFTDIAGFTSMCEGMSANEVATFINQHLTLLVDCVEAEGGTVDKYIGDALMAFWGAPEALENSALGACRAARAMVEAIAAENRQRVAGGEAPVRVRIGIHTGPLVVGNIGAPSRINYTVVGDTVNTTQRLEALGKEVAPDDEVTVLISETTRNALPDDFEVEPAGSFQVKGREEPVSVYRLLV